MDYLKSCSLREMVKVVNDPNRPERTKVLIRNHLNESHPGWHEQLDVAAPAKC
jgi:tRNA(Phe) wybutosine-synthesizing methylase Tyw3